MILQTPVQHHNFCGSVVKGFDLKLQSPGSSPRVIIHNLEQVSQLRPAQITDRLLRLGDWRDKALCLNLGDPCSNPTFAYFKSISSNKVTQISEQTMKSTTVLVDKLQTLWEDEPVMKTWVQIPPH